MGELTPSEKKEIIARRGNRCDRDSKIHRTSSLEVHHKDRNPSNNDPSNLRVLCRRHHDELHGRD
jgi:hypothetical protein